VVEFAEQIPDSLLPLVVFALFRLGDAAKRSLFQRAYLLLGELDQFAAEMFLIARFHSVASRRSSTVPMTKRLQRLAAGNVWSMRLMGIFRQLLFLSGMKVLVNR